MADLNQIKGINARQIKLLQDNGISTAEALAMSPSQLVSGIDGLGDKTARKLIWNARNALGMTEFTPAGEIDDNVEYITTGSSGLNQILGGGFQTGKLTEVYGPFKSGKTALAHTIAVTVQLPKKRGGLSGAVAYTDTENTLQKYNKGYDNNSDGEENFISNFKYFLGLIILHIFGNRSSSCLRCQFGKREVYEELEAKINLAIKDRIDVLPNILKECIIKYSELPMFNGLNFRDKKVKKKTISEIFNKIILYNKDLNFQRTVSLPRKNLRLKQMKSLEEDTF